MGANGRVGPTFDDDPTFFKNAHLNVEDGIVRVRRVVAQQSSGASRGPAKFQKIPSHPRLMRRPAIYI